VLQRPAARDLGPYRVRADELRAAFSDGWTVESITADTFDINPMNDATRGRRPASRHQAQLTNSCPSLPFPVVVRFRSWA